LHFNIVSSFFKEFIGRTSFGSILIVSQIIEFIDITMVMMMTMFPSRQQMDGARAVERWGADGHKENQSMACHARDPHLPPTWSP